MSGTNMGGSWQGGVAAATRVLEGLTELADFSPPAVLRLLKCMRGPPVRSPAEVERLVLVLNQAPPFSPKDLELVRKAQELRERAEQRGLADSAALADLRAQVPSDADPKRKIANPEPSTSCQ
eukprot:3357486-Rhodomonas_salina.2